MCRLLVATADDHPATPATGQPDVTGPSLDGQHVGDGVVGRREAEPGAGALGPAARLDRQPDQRRPGRRCWAATALTSARPRPRRRCAVGDGDVDHLADRAVPEPGGDADQLAVLPRPDGEVAGVVEPVAERPPAGGAQRRRPAQRVGRAAGRRRPRRARAAAGCGRRARGRPAARGSVSSMRRRLLDRLVLELLAEQPELGGARGRGDHVDHRQRRLAPDLGEQEQGRLDRARAAGEGRGVVAGRQRAVRVQHHRGRGQADLAAVPDRAERPRRLLERGGEGGRAVVVQARGRCSGPQSGRGPRHTATPRSPSGHLGTA